MNNYVLSAYCFAAAVFVLNAILAWKRRRGKIADET